MARRWKEKRLDRITQGLLLRLVEEIWHRSSRMGLARKRLQRQLISRLECSLCRILQWLSVNQGSPKQRMGAFSKRLGPPNRMKAWSLPVFKLWTGQRAVSLVYMDGCCVWESSSRLRWRPLEQLKPGARRVMNDWPRQAIQCKLGDMEFQKGICRFRNTEFQKGICKLGDMEFQKGICKLGDMEFQKGIFKLGNTEFQKGIFRLGDMEFQKGISRLLDTEFQGIISKLLDTEFQEIYSKLLDMEFREINGRFLDTEFQEGISSDTEFQEGISSDTDTEFQEGISMDTEFHIAQVLWSRVVQARNLYGGDHGRLSVGQGGGLFTGSRERGGMFDVAPGDVAYRQPEIQRGATFGDYDYEIGGSNPPRLSGPDGGLGGGPATARLDESGPSAAMDVEGSSAQPSTSTTKPGLAAETTTATPSPMDVLITGMTQLQQVLLRQKPEGLDLEPKAVQELAKLPEYAPETGAIDFQDFLYLAEQQIGSLASGAGDWWSRTLAVAQESYAEYQAMSPMRRLSVKPTLTSELRDERYKKLERKVAALLLAALPKSVREEMIAYRVQGTHQILFRLMIVYQPGGAQDRAQLLRQLDVTESAAGPVEAIASLRRWYRLLQRAADIGVKLPDESIQTRSLTMIVKKTADSFPDFKFRMALARTELQIDTRPTQDSVMRYLQHLLAELEHLGGNKKPAAATGTATTTSTTSAATTTLKGIQTQGDATPKAKAKSVAEKPCKYFATEVGPVFALRFYQAPYEGSGSNNIYDELLYFFAI
ncbi:hypothetical protein AK812_SmicGene11759 [Symbiodinium microadriaticum]|uniref:Uncharacterized protein n=1 Tax=Symbiodinium microadriaticum TaxID=2951 RepID=A0A1Q9ECE8_SYMMI|nr:hypothetical protein AK812_SmicGene11759 [Symbiodinium microadriaticum]